MTNSGVYVRNRGYEYPGITDLRDSGNARIYDICLFFPSSPSLSLASLASALCRKVALTVRGLIRRGAFTARLYIVVARISRVICTIGLEFGVADLDRQTKLS